MMEEQSTTATPTASIRAPTPIAEISSNPNTVKISQPPSVTTTKKPKSTTIKTTKQTTPTGVNVKPKTTLPPSIGNNKVWPVTQTPPSRRIVPSRPIQTYRYVPLTKLRNKLSTTTTTTTTLSTKKAFVQENTTPSNNIDNIVDKEITNNNNNVENQKTVHSPKAVHSSGASPVTTKHSMLTMFWSLVTGLVVVYQCVYNGS